MQCTEVHFQTKSGHCLTVLPSDQFLLSMAACDNPANIAAESRCQVVDDIPSQDQLADEMLASLYHTAHADKTQTLPNSLRKYRIKVL